MELDPANAARLKLRLGDLVVECGTLHAEDADGRRSIPPRALAVLLELARRPLATVTREELLDAVWKDSFPTPDALSHAVKELRRALGDHPREPRFVATVHGLGYRLLVVPELEQDGPVLPPASATPPPAQAVAPDPVSAPPPPRWLHPAWLGAALVAAVLVLALLLVPLAPAPRNAPPVLDAGSRLEPLTADLGRESLPSISPDGSAVAYAYAPPGSDAYRIHLRGVGALGSRQLSALEEPGLLETAPAWSLDGTRIAFFRYRSDDGGCAIVVADVHAGSEEELPGCHGHVLQHLSWTGDSAGLVISVPQRDADLRLSAVIHTMDLAERVPRPLDYPHASGMIDLEPRVSPDGRWIAFRRGANPYTDLFLMHSDGSGLRRLTDWGLPTRGFTWLSDSRTLAVSVTGGDTAGLRFVTVDQGALDASVADWGAALDGALYPSAAARGTAMVFARFHTELQVSGWPVGQADHYAERTAAPQVASSRSDWDAAVAPVGGSVVFVSDRLGEATLLLAEASPGAPVVQLAQHAGMRPRAPAWSADASRIAYVAQGPGRSEGYVVDVAQRTGLRIGEEGERIHAMRFTPGGELVVSSDRGGALSLWLVAPDGSDWRPLDVPGATLGAVAADGTLFFMREGDPFLYRRPLAGGAVTVVAENLALVDSGSWVVQPDGVYAVRVQPSSLLQGQSIDHLPWPAQGEPGWETEVAMPEGFANPRISVSDDTSTVYAAKERLQGADLFLWRWNGKRASAQNG